MAIRSKLLWGIFNMGVVLVSSYAHAQIQLADVDQIEVYAMNPQITQTFARVNAGEIISSIRAAISSNTYDEHDDYYRSIRNKTSIRSIVTEVNKLVRREQVDMDEVSARVVLIFHREDHLLDTVILDHYSSQAIYAFQYECRPSKQLYEAIIKYLPKEWRKHPKFLVDRKWNNDSRH